MWSRGVVLLTGLLLVGAGLSACASLDPGPRRTEDRPVEDVAVVELATSGSLDVTVGTTPSLTITAGEQVIDRLTADVESGVLRLGFRDEPREYVGEIHYELVVSALSSISVLGSGDARVDLAGATDPSIIVRGSGDVEATGIDAQTVALTLDGSGSIGVNDAAARQLTVRIDGSGGVRIDGTWSIRTSRSAAPATTRPPTSTAKTRASRSAAPARRACPSPGRWMRWSQEAARSPTSAIRA